MSKSNKKYWEDRLLDYSQNVIKDVDKLNDNLIEAYVDATDRLQKELMKIYTEYTDGNGEVSYTKLLKYKQLKKLNSEMKKIAENLAQTELDFMGEKFPEILKDSYENAGVLLQVGFDTLNEQAIDYAVNYPWSGANYSDIVWDNKELLLKTLSKTVTKGIIDGTSVTDMMLKLKDIMGKEEWKCRRIVRTEAMHLVNSGNIERYKKAGVTELEYLATHDYYSTGKPRYCEACISDNNKKFPIDKAPILPRHPNCRCTYIPVIETMKEPEEATKKIEYREFTKETIEDIQQLGLEWAKALTNMEKKFIKDYTGSDYMGLNRALRTENQETIKFYERNIRFLERAIKKYEVTEPFSTYRGMSYRFLESIDEDFYDEISRFGKYTKAEQANMLKDKLLGNIINDKGYCSTAVTPERAFSGDVKMRIKVTEGKGKGAFIQSLSKFKSENEFLINKNSNFLVENVYFDEEKHIIIIDTILL